MKLNKKLRKLKKETEITNDELNRRHFVLLKILQVQNEKILEELKNCNYKKGE